MYNYVVTAHKPTVVSHTAVGNFLGPDQRNLLVARVNYIQVYTITPEGLQCTVVFPINGTISAMHLIQVPGDSQQNLIIATAKQKLSMVRWNANDSRCHVVLSGDVKDNYSTNEAKEAITTIDPEARCIALHQYARLLKIIPTAPGADKTAFNVRLLEDEVFDMVFLPGYKNPTIAILTPDKDARELRTYEISMSTQDVLRGDFHRADLDATTNKIVAVPGPIFGVIVFGDDTVQYVPRSGNIITRPIDPTVIKAVGVVDNDGSRYLVGDNKGQLMMLMLERDRNSGKVKSIRTELLGEISVPKCISYLDNGFVFIGSENGDSQLIRLSTKKYPENGSFLTIVQTYPHLGPILDFCVIQGMGYLRQGQGQVVTCSGVGKDGSLRVIRNGIGISEHAAEELPGIKCMYSLRRNVGDRYHTFLMQSFTSETRVLELVGADEMAPAELPGFDEDSPTLYAGNMIGNLLIQVTASAVNVIDCSSMEAVPQATWTPPENSRISIATGNNNQLLVASTGGHLTFLEPDVDNKTITEVSHVKLDREISCINCNGLRTSEEMIEADDTPAEETKAFMAVVGLWTEVKESPVVKLIALPSLKTVYTIDLGGDVIARGALLATLEGCHYLLVALGDGSLLTYCVNAEASAEAAVASTGGEDQAMARVDLVTERRKVSLGSQPAELSIFKSRGADHIFAACDRPTVVYSATGGGKLLVSNVNLQEVINVCGFDTESFPDCLAISTETGLHLGAVDEIQKLHITPVPLGEQPLSIVHMESARVFAVLTELSIYDEKGDESLEHYVRIIDDSRYDTLFKYKLKTDEVGSSILSAHFDGPGLNVNTEFLVVGTAFDRDEENPKEGRILFFRITDGRPVLVGEKTVDGAVFDMCCFNGMLLASLGIEVQLFSVGERKDGALIIKSEDRHIGYTLGFRLAIRGDFILVGDIIRSVSVLICKKINDQYQLEQVAKDFDTVMAQSIEMLNDDTYLVAENAKHLLTYKRNSSASTDQERGRLERVGQFHLGQRINRIRHGSLVMQMPESESAALKTLIFGSPTGMLGVVANLKPESYQFFLALQKAMATLIPGVGGFDHAEWREMQMKNPPVIAPSQHFLDGDLIERFLDLNLAQMNKVSAMVNVGAETIVRRVEEMQRLHGAG